MKLVIYLNMSSFPLHFFTQIGPLYLDLITYLVVFLLFLSFIADSHATLAELEVYGSTISHTIND